MTTDQQVRLLMTLIKQGLPVVTAAAKAGMSERTARKYRRSGKLPREGSTKFRCARLTGERQGVTPGTKE